MKFKLGWYAKSKENQVYRSGIYSCFRKSTLSRACLKSSMITRILLSLSANKPASKQIALMSAPDMSAFEFTISSIYTSSSKVMRFV